MLFSFPKTFWVANLMELFERGAYYGMNALLAVYLTDVLGFREQSVGVLQGFVYALTYVGPIFGGALAERLGYRKMLLVAFSLLTLGYFAAGNFDTYGLVFVSLLVMATGSGLFKPIISGTIARTTTKETSGFGFGVYYWSINLGAFIAPLVMSWLKGFSYRYVFFAAAAWCFLMLLPALFLYKDPDLPKSTKRIGQVLSDALKVLRDSRFMLMIFVYSCFWILYFQNFGSVLWYLRDFIDRAPVDRFMAGLGISFRFDAEHVTVINAGTIILLVVLVSRIVKNLKPLPVMTVGVLFGAGGFLILALTRSAWMLVLGIAVFSLGEMTAHPKYYSYIGVVAPRDSVAVYMGYAFLYGVIGSLIGSNFGAVLYERMLTPLAPRAAEALKAGTALPPDITATLRTFWLIFAALGVVCVAGMLLYNTFFSEDTPRTNRRAWRIMLGVYGLLALAGLYFLVESLFLSPQIQVRTLVQSLILLGLGG
ncbi:MAG: MFS transporter, partial [Candidatus Aminicenantes bacterium]|nr:MFS transporter [Candidatus Aminicenantes bacterium]